jgi:hypothetical protein
MFSNLKNINKKFPMVIKIKIKIKKLKNKNRKPL